VEIVHDKLQCVRPSAPKSMEGDNVSNSDEW